MVVIGGSETTTEGDRQAKVGDTTSWIMNGPEGNAITGTQWIGADGSTSTTWQTSKDGLGYQGSSGFDASTGTFSQSIVETAQTPDGQTQVNSKYAEIGPGGSATADSTAGTTADGGFFTVSNSSSSDGSSQSSSFVADGQGNTSETTVTRNADGSFTITTTSTDSQGNTTTDSQAYDQGGKAVGDPTRKIDETDPYSDDNDDTSGDEDDTSGGDGDTGDDGDTGESDTSGGGGSGGEMPSDDGTDETPNPRHQGSGDASFAAIAAASHGPGLAVRDPSVDTGDPAASVAADVDNDAGGAESSVGIGDWRESPIAITATIDVPEGEDPNLNPRALVAVAAAAFGRGATKALERLL